MMMLEEFHLRFSLFLLMSVRVLYSLTKHVFSTCHKRIVGICFDARVLDLYT